MNKRMILVYVALAIGGSPIAFAQNAPVASSQSIDANMIPTRAQQTTSMIRQSIEAIKLRLKAAKEALAIHKQRVGLGIETSEGLTDKEAKIVELETELSFAQQRLLVSQRLDSLSKLANITLDKASVASVANLLAKVSGFAIYADSTVPEDMVVTFSATNTPVGTILEYIANASKLSLALDEQGALKLAMPQKLIVNGKAIDIVGTKWPWSDSSNVNQEFFNSWQTQGNEQKLNRFIDFRTDPIAGIAPAMSASALSVTPLGSSMVLISEPGSGKKGEPGYWLTLYTVKNGQLKLSSKLFHSSVRPPAVPLVYTTKPVELRFGLPKRVQAAKPANKVKPVEKKAK